jgi:hypothetical protein
MYRKHAAAPACDHGQIGGVDLGVNRRVVSAEMWSSAVQMMAAAVSRAIAGLMPGPKTPCRAGRQ